MKVFISVFFVAFASAQLPPMLNNYVPYGALPIVRGPPIVSRGPIGSSIVSGPTILSESMHPMDMRTDTCIVRCGRQCQNDRTSSTVSDLRSVGVTGYVPNHGSRSSAFTSLGLNTDFSSGMSSDTSRLTLSPSSKTSSSVGQVSVKG